MRCSAQQRYSSMFAEIEPASQQASQGSFTQSCSREWCQAAEGVLVVGVWVWSWIASWAVALLAGGVILFRSTGFDV